MRTNVRNRPSLAAPTGGGQGTDGVPETGGPFNAEKPPSLFGSSREPAGPPPRETPSG
jgi:hypothetical protein